MSTPSVNTHSAYTHHRKLLALSALIVLSTLTPLWAAEVAPLTADHQQAVFLLIIYVVMAIGFSFLCSIAEAVLLSITPSYVEQLRERNPLRALRLQRLKMDNIDRSLAAILTLNTVAHTVGAIGAGAQANAVFGSYWFGVFSAVMTLLILFASEIVPKTLGAVFWSRLVLPTMWYIQFLIVVLYPAVWVSEVLTKVIAWGKKPSIFSRDEFDAMARVGYQEGKLNDKEARIIRNLLRFGSLRASDIMTPRTVITALDQQITLEQAAAVSMRYPFSRVPIFDDNIDKITGFVMRYEILLGNSQGRGQQPLASLRRDMLFLPKGASLSSMLETFLDGRHHIAVVVDDFGGAAGLVTLEDLIEALMGMEIIDELDGVDDMQGFARKQWLERARALGIVEANSDVSIP